MIMIARDDAPLKSHSVKVNLTGKFGLPDPLSGTVTAAEAAAGIGRQVQHVLAEKIGQIID